MPKKAAKPQRLIRYTGPADEREITVANLVGLGVEPDDAEAVVWNKGNDFTVLAEALERYGEEVYQRVVSADPNLVVEELAAQVEEPAEEVGSA